MRSRRTTRPAFMNALYSKRYAQVPPPPNDSGMHGHPHARSGHGAVNDSKRRVVSLIHILMAIAMVATS